MKALLGLAWFNSNKKHQTIYF